MSDMMLLGKNLLKSFGLIDKTELTNNPLSSSLSDSTPQTGISYSKGENVSQGRCVRLKTGKNE